MRGNGMKTWDSHQWLRTKCLHPCVIRSTPPGCPTWEGRGRRRAFRNGVNVESMWKAPPKYIRRTSLLPCRDLGVTMWSSCRHCNLSWNGTTLRLYRVWNSFLVTRRTSFFLLYHCKPNSRITDSMEITFSTGETHMLKETTRSQIPEELIPLKSHCSVNCFCVWSIGEIRQVRLCMRFTAAES